MRTITLIIIHCSDVRPNQTSRAAQIDQWHKKRGWKCIGYHYVIRRDGSIERGRPESMVGAHCLNHNQHSIGVCYESGLDANGKAADTRTPKQRASMRALLVELKQSYPALSSWDTTSSPTNRVLASMQLLSTPTFNLVNDFNYDFR